MFQVTVTALKSFLSSNTKKKSSLKFFWTATPTSFRKKKLQRRMLDYLKYSVKRKLIIYSLHKKKRRKGTPLKTIINASYAKKKSSNQTKISTTKGSQKSLKGVLYLLIKIKSTRILLQNNLERYPFKNRTLVFRQETPVMNQM